MRSCCKQLAETTEVYHVLFILLCVYFLLPACSCFWSVLLAVCCANFVVQQSDTDQVQSGPSFVVVVAIDFGTTSSGYAYAFTKEPECIHTMRWANTAMQTVSGVKSGGGVNQQNTIH